MASDYPAIAATFTAILRSLVATIVRNLDSRLIHGRLWASPPAYLPMQKRLKIRSKMSSV